MSQDSPPSLHFARQWTQPTDFEPRQTLTRVAYPPTQHDRKQQPHHEHQLRELHSFSPSPLRHSRTPLTPGSAAPHTASRPTRQPLVTTSTVASPSSEASPLPVRPTLPSSRATPATTEPTRWLSPDARQTPPRRRQTSPFVGASSPRDAYPLDGRDDAARQPRDDPGRLFWQQQAQRFEEANAKLRHELNAIYRVLEENNNNKTTNSSHHRPAVAGDEQARRADESGSMESYMGHHHNQRQVAPQPRPQSTNSSQFGEISLEEAIMQRNMARMELAQEREKTFLLRHRLREAEMELERLQYQQQQRQRHATDDRRDHRPAPPANRVTSASDSSRGKRAPQTAAVSAAPLRPNRSRSRSATRAPPSTTSSTPLSASSSLSSSVRAASRPRRAPSSPPRSRSATRRQSSQHDRHEPQIHHHQYYQHQKPVSGPSSKDSSVEGAGDADLAALSRCPLRGYARLQQRKEAESRRLTSSTSLDEKNSKGSHSSLSPSPSLSPLQEAFSTRVAPPTARLREGAVPPQQESKARALLSTLLAAHSAPTTSTAPTFPVFNTHDPLSRFSTNSTQSESNDVAPRHLFRSQLFSADAAGTHDTANTQRSHSLLSDGETGNPLDTAGPYVSRQLVSPTPPLRPAASPAELDSLSHVLAQRLSGSGTWQSVSATTEEDAASRGLSPQEDATEGGVAWSSAAAAAAYHSFSL